MANIVTTTTPIAQTHIFLDPAQISVLRGSGHAFNAASGMVAFPKSPETKVIQQMVLTNQYPLVEGSSNDIFDLTSTFSVRRVPDVDQIRAFMVEFLNGGKGQFTGGSGRFMTL